MFPDVAICDSQIASVWESSVAGFSVWATSGFKKMPKCHYQVEQTKMEVANIMHKGHVSYFHLLCTAYGCIVASTVAHWCSMTDTIISVWTFEDSH